MLFALLTCLLLFVGCNNAPTSDKQPSIKKEVPKKKKVANMKKDSPGGKTVKPLNTDNAVEYLLEYGRINPENVIVLSTSKGDIKLRLYDDTPIHRANFIRLVKNAYYENTEFYRVVPDFMIQGAQTDNVEVKKRRAYFGRYRIPSEFKEKYMHRRGALAMSRSYDNNPEKMSSSFDFYIVQGGILSIFQLNAIANSQNISISEAKREIYTTIGGAPHLDNSHTVFGEVLEGMHIVDSIAAVRTDGSDWPIEAVTMNMKVIKL